MVQILGDSYAGYVFGDCYLGKSLEYSVVIFVYYEVVWGVGLVQLGRESKEVFELFLVLRVREVFLVQDFEIMGQFYCSFNLGTE